MKLSTSQGRKYRGYVRILPFFKTTDMDIEAEKFLSPMLEKYRDMSAYIGYSIDFGKNQMEKLL